MFCYKEVLSLYVYVFIMLSVLSVDCSPLGHIMCHNL